jgi:hypothetical protein
MSSSVRKPRPSLRGLFRIFHPRAVIHTGGRKDWPGTSNSLRIDIPKNDAPEENPRRDGVEYFDGDDKRFSDRRPADKPLSEIFGKPGK